jgi:O-antigen biosynthesis protein
MKVSCFTPTHNTKYLTELWESIKDQPFDEWVILAQGCEVPDFKDERVKVFNYPKLGDHYVGALKKEACRLCTGDILLEIDHDDILVDGAIEEVKKAFKDPEIGFVYSNFSNFKDDFQKVDRYNADYGWKYRPFTYKGHELDEYISFDPSPEAISLIGYAPNHLRAWRTDVYKKLGGHLDNTRVLDDHELLIRTFQATKMKRIDKCLYLYRITGDNTWIRFNAEIQTGTQRLRDKHIEDLALSVEGRKIDLGGRFNCPLRYESVDLKDADLNFDLNGKWELEDNSCSVVRAFDCFEHLKDPIHTMKELSRVLKPGGIAFIQVPSTDGRGAFQDPTHISFWNENSFLYYTNQNWAKYIDTPVRFQALKLTTTEKDANQVCWVHAELVNLKDNYFTPGLILI